MPDLSRLSVNHVTLLEQCSMGQFADALDAQRHRLRQPVARQGA